MSDLHLDDEVISAVLDGEAAPEDSAHADACAECDARLAALRDASLLVRTPVPPPDDDRREQAIAAALDAMPATVVPLRPRRTAPAWLAAAAAVLVVALASVALLGRGGDDGRDDGGFAAGDDAADTMAADEELSTMAAPAPVLDGGDLGAVDITALEGIVGGALRRAVQAERESGAPGGGDTATTAADGDASGAGGAGAAAFCEDRLRVDNTQLGALVYRATGTLDGEDVVVLAFDVSRDDGSVDRWVYVLSADGCAVRNQQTFAA